MDRLSSGWSDADALGLDDPDRPVAALDLTAHTRLERDAQHARPLAVELGQRAGVAVEPAAEAPRPHLARDLLPRAAPIDLDVLGFEERLVGREGLVLRVAGIAGRRTLECDREEPSDRLDELRLELLPGVL